jgi:hypothetical protein
VTEVIESAEDLIRKHAPEIANQIKQAAQEAWGNEAQLRGNLARNRVFEGFAEHLELILQPREEYTLINGRADAVYNRFVIEYEPPGSLTAKDSHKNRHAVGQVKQYIEGLVKKERHKPERLAGVATDGCYFIFGRFRAGVWHEDDPLPVTADSTARFLASLYLLSTEKALTADNLVRDFGENSNVARIAVSAIYKALTESQNPKVKVIYDQWRQQFSEVCGYEEGSPRLDIRLLAKQYGVQDSNPNAFRLFFSIHTYYATFIKLLAVQVVHYYVAPKLGTALPQVASYPTDRLQKYLRNMERGGIFKDLGISNFLEGDFFGWYLEVWDDSIDNGVRRVVSELANYSLVTLDADPDETRDLLKKLYQNVMPKQLRHDLGEYYTPDWLAERLLNQLGFTSEREPRLHEKRLLDPACGSGTFLVLSIKRVREHCAERPVKPADLLHKIQSNIMGFDLNPLAVISARTNYLLALGDLLEAPRDFEVNIPVYLCDSILTPAQAEEKVGDQYRMMGAEEKLYKFKTVVGEFAVPGSLVKAQYIDQLAGLVEECVDAKFSVQDFRKRLLNTFPLVQGKDDLDIQVLEQLYAKINKLAEDGINGIWARIIKNAFAPLFCGQFDYVAGNPPWVNWESLPDEYRNELIPLNQNKYKLFLVEGILAHHGGTKIDLSSLMYYTSADRYLRTTGKIGFVVTQTLFKSEAAGRGFRRFEIEGSAKLMVQAVDDFVAIKPFEGATNRPAVIVANKGQPTRYPISYITWRKLARRSSVPEDATLDMAIALTMRSEWQAKPIDRRDLTSPWITGRRRALDAIEKCLGQSDYTVKPGTCTWANGVYWLALVSERPDGLVLVSNMGECSRPQVDSVQAGIEPDLIFPLLRGEDVHQWQSQPQNYILVPQDPTQPSRGFPEDSLRASLPKTFAFLKRFESILSSRSGYLKYLSSQPFYSIYNIGAYTFAPVKLVWREQAAFLTAAVVTLSDAKVTIPDHKLMLVPFDSPEPAHFLCSILSSSPAQFLVKAYIVETSTSTHVLDHLHIPQFNPKSKLHTELAALSEQAHGAMADGDQETVEAIEKRIDDLAAELWRLTKDELKEIQESLAELR